MKKKNIHLIISSIIVVVSLVVIDLIIGVVGDYAMKHMPDYSGQIAKNNFRLNRVNTDVVIVGSSRGAHHYVTEMLRDSINSYTGGNYTVYNSAIDGNFINSNSCAAESIMDRYSPDLLIFEVSEWELGGGQAERDMEFTAVNYHNNRFVKKYLDDMGFKEKLKMTSNLFRFNQKALRIVSSYIQKGSENGYEPLYKKMTVIPKIVSEPHNMDDYSIKNFKRVLQTATEKGINLIIVSSPSFTPKDNNRILAELCGDYNIPYVDCYNIKEFNEHPELFKDPIHLNDDGARLYTDRFFQKIKPYLGNMVNK